MKTFVFRLATLLKLREAQRDRRRGELANAEQALAIIDQRLSELEQEMNAARQAVRQAATVGEVVVDVLLDNQRYELMLIAEQQSVATQRVQVAVESDRRRELLVQADRQVKMLEKLRERQQRQHRAEAAALDAKLLDEVANRGYAVRMAESCVRDSTATSANG